MDIQTFRSSLEDQLQIILEEHNHLKTPDDNKSKSRAFGAWILSNYFDVSETDAVDAIVDDGDDKGIDFIHLPDNGSPAIVGQVKLLQNMERNFPRNEVMNTLNGIDWLLNGDLSKVSNRAFVAKAEEFREGYTSFDFQNVNIVFAGSCKKPAQDGMDEITKFLVAKNRMKETFISNPIDIQAMFDKYRIRLQRNADINTTLELSDDPYERIASDTDTRALVGTIKGEYLAKLFDVHRDVIFESNIRNYLGNSKINISIMETAKSSDEANNFWFFNNGVTFVCDKFSFRSTSDLKNVNIEGIQIINGCQTVTSLHRAWEEGELKNEVEVLIKIIEQPESDFINKVTINTNSQNAVRSPDFVGNDFVQLDLKRRLESMGYFYETRRGDYAAKYPNRKSRIEAFGDAYQEKKISLSDVAKTLAAFLIEEPVIAKNKTTSLYYSRNEGGYYEEIFGRKTSPQMILGALKLLRNITKKRKAFLAANSDVKYDWLSYADYYLLSIIHFVYFDKNQTEDTDYVNAFFESIEKEFDKMHSDIIEKITKMVSKKSKTKGYSHPKYFKTQASYEKIIELFEENIIVV